MGAEIPTVSILLVDDEDFVRRVIRQVLAGLGYTHVMEEVDGLDAAQRLQVVKYDLVLTDVLMPRMNGLELLRNIRCGQTAAPRDSRVLIITSFSNTEVLRTALALDVNGFLVKPMKPVNVEEKIKAAMRERFQVREAEQYARVHTDLRSIQDESRAAATHQATANAGILRGARAAPGGSSGAPPAVAGPPGAVPEGAVPEGAVPEGAVPEGAVQVSAWKLRSGMVLCEDLRLTDGTLILSAKHMLSENSVNRLRDLRALLADEVIWVLVADTGT